MIRLAELTDLNEIEAIYNEIHTEEELGHVKIGWNRAIYPVRATAEDSIQKHTMFVLETEDGIVASAKINQVQGSEYLEAKWTCQVPDEEVMVLHTLTVSPRYQGKGYGREFISFYEQYALEHGCHYLRIDTQNINATARKLYGGLGYREIDIVDCTFNGIPGIKLVCLEKMI